MTVACLCERGPFVDFLGTVLAASFECDWEYCTELPAGCKAVVTDAALPVEPDAPVVAVHPDATGAGLRRFVVGIDLIVPFAADRAATSDPDWSAADGHALGADLALHRTAQRGMNTFAAKREIPAAARWVLGSEDKLRAAYQTLWVLHAAGPDGAVAVPRALRSWRGLLVAVGRSAVSPAATLRRELQWHGLGLDAAGGQGYARQFVSPRSFEEFEVDGSPVLGLSLCDTLLSYNLPAAAVDLLVLSCSHAVQILRELPDDFVPRWVYVTRSPQADESMCLANAPRYTLADSDSTGFLLARVDDFSLS